MLKVKEKEPYIILPRQRYNLSTYEPHNVMNGDFTFFVDFNLDSTNDSTEYGIIMRPGIHMGIVVKRLHENLSILTWDYWTKDKNGNNKWNSIQFQLSPNEKCNGNDRFFVYLQHNLKEKLFTMYVNCKKFDKPYVIEQKYNDMLVDYSDTPYNLGCGNYNKIVPEKDKLFSSCTFYKLGLIGNIEYSYDQIIKFLELTKNDKTDLSKKLFDIVFYFNFNAQNIYKVWDLSGHCNFIQKNLYIEDETFIFQY